MGVRFTDGSPEQLFHELERRHHTAVDKLLAERGIGGIGQPVILSVLSQQKDGTIESQKELARRISVSPATVTVSLKSMERDGYVRKLSNAQDLRCKPITITEKGLEAARLIDEVFELLDRGMYQGFTQEEREAASLFYRRVIRNLDAAAGRLENEKCD